MMCTLAQYAIVNPEIYALGTQAAIVSLGLFSRTKSAHSLEARCMYTLSVQ